jgi:phage virion morphogenesis protein
MPLGVQIELRDISGVRDRLAKLAAVNPDKSLPVIGETLVEHIREGFANERDPDGAPWKRLSDTTLALRRQGSGGGGARILQDTRRLYNSINAQVRGAGVAVGTNVIYAATQQFGRDDNRIFGRAQAPIPARPFLPWKSPNAKPELPKAWTEDIIGILEDLYDG